MTDSRDAQRKLLDEQITAEPQLPPPVVAADARPAPVEEHLRQLRRPLALDSQVTRASSATGLWEKYRMALDDVTERLERITRALEEAGVPYALVGGQAVALWVATKDPAAVRTTKDVDILRRREDLPKARAAAAAIALDYFEMLGVGMFLERSDPNPRKGVHLLWAGEKVRPECSLPSPTVAERQMLAPGQHVVSLAGLVRMKLVSNRDQDRVHLRDLIDVDLISRDLLTTLPAKLASLLDTLLTEAGR